jgi:hypothetical protein
MTEQRPPVDPDDLAPWADDDLVRALRAPGTATELADEERYVAAFREASRSNVRSLPRRAVGRLGAGGTAVVVTVALTSGVAAAYTGHLPDPVQTLAHHIINAPAPGAPGRQRPEATAPSGGTGTGTQSDGPDASPSTPTSTGPTTGTSSPTSTPGTSAGSSGSNPTNATNAPTTSPTSVSGSAAAATSMSAATHRVGFGQTMTLTGQVTDAHGAPLPGQAVVLQVRGPRHWRPVTQVTADDTGVASASTPPVTRSARLRWHSGPGVNSLPWRIAMVPILTVSAEVGGTTTTITPAAQGAAPGDRVQVFRHTGGRSALLRRASLDANGGAAITVATPRRHAAYVVRLLPTKLHAAVRARVVVVPPRAAAVSITGSTSRVSSGVTAVIGGTVTSASGATLAGHKVVLLQRGPARWRRVGHAVSDSAGHVSIATPPITATSRFRLRSDHRAHSATWRIVEQPDLQASAQRSGSTLVVSATASGGRTGDKVVLLRRVAGRLVKMRHARLDSSGSVTFSVGSRKPRTTYVVRLVATRRHGSTSASVVVPKIAG